MGSKREYPQFDFGCSKVMGRISSTKLPASCLFNYFKWNIIERSNYEKIQIQSLMWDFLYLILGINEIK